MFKQLRNRWCHVLVGKTEAKCLLDFEKKYMSTLDDEVEALLQSIVSTTDRTYLWEDEKDFTQSQKQTNNYRRVLQMCKAYCTRGSRYYQDTVLVEVIKEALRFLYRFNYNTSHTYYYGNWWNWEIGTPITLLNIMTLLGDDLSDVERTRYCEVIRYFQPDPKQSGERSSNLKIKRRTSVGGNRVDTAKIAILLGIHLEDGELIQAGRDALSDVFCIKSYEPMTVIGEKRDGLYEDWSFIQHGDVAYTGTYGNVLLGGLGELIYLLNESKWQVTDPQVENIYRMILESFAPIIYKGHGMDCVNGRGATRQEARDNKIGHDIISSMLWFCAFAPKQYSDAYKQHIKYWLKEDRIRDYMTTQDQIPCLQMAYQLLEDNSIKKAQPLEGNFAYTYMDRMIHHRKSFACALSMSSHRIRTYEPMLQENKRGFYTGDGMVWLYTDDQEQYTRDYWPTINPYKLPGTTVLKRLLKDEEGSFRTAQQWVSCMSVDGKYGIAGMALTKKGVNDQTQKIENLLHNDLEAKKSYFMLDEEIIALGAGISCSCEEHVITTLDTRKLTPSSEATLHQENYWLYIEGNVPQTAMGYYTLDHQKLQKEVYTQSGSWYEVNGNGDQQVKTQRYVSVFVDHGVAPQGQNYAYSMMPCISKKQLIKRANEPQVEVIANTHKVQAIKWCNYKMINAYEPVTVAGLSLSQPASLVVKTLEDELEITVCDPTKENHQPLKLYLEDSDVGNQIEHPLIGLETCDEKTYIQVDWESRKGQSVVFKVKMNRLNK